MLDEYSKLEMERFVLFFLAHWKWVVSTIATVGDCVITRLFPYPVLKVECTSLYWPSYDSPKMTLILNIELVPLLRYRKRAYITIPEWTSTRQYLLNRPHPLEPNSKLQPLEHRYFQVTVDVLGVLPKKRNCFTRILKESGAYLNIESVWRTRKPVRKLFKWKGN